MQQGNDNGDGGNACKKARDRTALLWRPRSYGRLKGIGLPMKPSSTTYRESSRRSGDGSRFTARDGCFSRLNQSERKNRDLVRSCWGNNRLSDLAPEARHQRTKSPVQCQVKFVLPRIYFPVTYSVYLVPYPPEFFVSQVSKSRPGHPKFLTLITKSCGHGTSRAPVASPYISSSFSHHRGHATPVQETVVSCISYLKRSYLPIQPVPAFQDTSLFESTSGKTSFSRATHT